MRNLLGKILLGAGFAGIALLSLTAAAWSGGHGEMMPDPGRMMAHMADRLDLSDSQREQAEQIITASMDQTAQDREEMGELREQLHAMRGNFDPDTARSISERIGVLTGQMVYQVANTQSQIYEMLTPEQREQMETLREQHGERRGKWHRRLGGQGDEE